MSQSMSPSPATPPDPEAEPSRRGLLTGASTAAMRLGLLGGYGLFAYMAARFLYPARPQRKRWLFVAESARLQVGDALRFQGPAGETVNIARQGREGGAGDFIALSSTCPHLGCQVRWEGPQNRFFCPCHNGTFDPSGKATGGPPGEAGQSLPRYPLKVERGLLFVELPVESLATAAQGRILDAGEGVQGPGHDPCLACPRPGSRAARTWRG